ncbi:MAG TPA: glycosyltransferase family 39 protein [Gemmatimonadaceae bacterium]|nr:glycosyltransferase family 39 protein [Gemmatimonadaceae bacterium]
MKRRVLLLVAGAALLLLAWKLPTGWYDSLPRQPDTPPLPLRGVDLLRLTFLLESIVCVVLAFVAWRYKALAPSERLTLKASEPTRDLSRSAAAASVVVIAFIAAFLRFYHLGSDLWLDEITPVVDYGHMPWVQVMGSYLRTNNHLLNTLMIKLSIGVFGESEWSIRLPAVLFGIAAVPALYWLARTVLSRWASVGAAAMFAASYHHVFFSQNARGYSAYLFFSIVATALLLRALTDDKSWRWVLYVFAMVLGFTSLANMVFVFAAHVIVSIAAVNAVHRQGGVANSLVRRLAVVFAAAGFLSFQVYAAPLPEMYVLVSKLYVREATGYAPFSREFFAEIARGLSAGFGGIVPAIILAVAGIIGIVFFFRRNAYAASALALPPVLTAMFLLVRGLSFSPRFFLLLIPLAILTAMSTVQASDHAKRAGIIGVCLAAASLLTLPAYYRTPKQSYRAAIQYLDGVRTPDESIVVVYAASEGMKYYVPRVAKGEAGAYHYSRTLPSFDSLVAPPKKALVVTTFPRILRADLPDLSERITSEWRPQRVFPATVGDGEITVWSRK